MNNASPTFFPLEKLSSLHEGYRRVFELQGLDLLLLRHQGRDYLLENLCPHAAYPLHEGVIVDNQLRCPMHGYRFALADGACTYYTEGPCRGLHSYQLEERDGNIGVVL